MSALVSRFQRSRWSPTRRAIDALAVGASVTLAAGEYDNAITAIRRLREAYDDGREYRHARTAAGLTITRTR